MAVFSQKYDQHSFETSVFKYTYNEFVTLRNVSSIISAISLASSALIIFVYIYMLFYHRKQANRVSLRCVFLCSVADLLNAILTICITSQRGDSQFCRASSVIIEFANIWSATLLTLVGINLVLIFVINVKRRDLLEKFYYPCAFVYTFVGIAVSINQQVHADSLSFEHYSCWYLKYVEDRTNNLMPWMWCYAFIFFVNIIAVCCSILAMTKLIREQKLVASRMHTINADSTFTSKHTDSQLNKTVKQRHNNVFSKVVLRCTIYPLVPFLVNIFGFILQMLITATKQTPSFTLAMLDIVFSCLEGVFVAIVFFTDPAITSFMSSTYSGWCEKYVEQYALVPKCEKKPTTPANSPSLSPIDSNQIAQPHFTTSQQPDNNFLDVYNIQRLSSNEQLDIEKRQHGKMKTVAMRRLHFEAAHHNKERQHQRMRQLSSISFETTTSPPIAITRHNNNMHQPQLPNTALSTVKDVYVPYRFPFLATCFHHILTFIGHEKSTTYSTPATTTTKQDSQDTLNDNNNNHNNNIFIPSSTSSQSPSSTVIVITEDTTKDEEEQQPQEIDFYTMIEDESSSANISTFNTHHI